MKPSGENALSWLVTLFTGSYVAWVSYSLSVRVPALAQLFSSLGAELPLPTRVAIAVCTPAVLWPLAAGIVAVLIVKELRIERVRTKVLISTLVFMGTAFASAVVTEALFQPMLRLIAKVG